MRVRTSIRLKIESMLGFFVRKRKRDEDVEKVAFGRIELYTVNLKTFGVSDFTPLRER